jgi:alkanesulfonate monooxygenase SsuD/methylene tetrahydromethanopterin reductase-like flavin-dependent oxidoreductase (luciferase family)
MHPPISRSLVVFFISKIPFEKTKSKPSVAAQSHRAATLGGYDLVAARYTAAMSGRAVRDAWTVALALADTDTLFTGTCAHTLTHISVGKQ